MKRIILLCVSVALLVTCLVAGTNKNAIHAGSGFGGGASIEEPEELLELLAFANGDEDSEFDSATIKMEHDYSVSGSGNTGSESIDAEVYIDGEKCFYRVKRIGSENVSVDDVLSKISYLFDYDLFIDEEDSYICFREFSYASKNRSLQIKSEYKGKWMELSGFIEDYVGSSVSLSELSESTSSFYGNIQLLIEEGELKKGDSRVRLNEEDLAKIRGVELPEASDGIENKLDFRVDLMSSSNPVLFLGGYYKVTSENEGSRDSDSTTILRFSDINNTEISFEKSCVEYYEADFEYEDDLFIISKRGD